MVIELLRFIILGLGIGSLYVLMAIGILVVHRGSGVVNFASGAMGMVGAFAFWELRDVVGVPTPIAIAIGISASAAVGWISYWCVMRPLRKSSSLARLIATLGILLFLQSSVALRYDEGIKIVAPFLPTDTWEISGITLGKDRVILFLSSLALTAVLWRIYRGTRFGIATAAVSQNAQAASAAGVSPNVVAGANWAIGGALAGVAAICLVPIIGLEVSHLTLLVIPALAAAVIGKFSSFPATMVAGLAIGVVQSLLAWRSDTPGIGEAIPFVFVATVLVLRGRAIADKGDGSESLPSLGTGRVRVRLLLLVLAPLLAATWFLLPVAWLDGLTLHLCVAIVILSVVVVTGYSGQLSLVQFGFAGVGALVAGILSAHYNLPFWLAVVLGAAATIPVAIAIGLASVRTRGTNLAVLTLGCAVALEALVFNNPKLTGGISGLMPAPPRVLGLEVDSLMHPERYATLCLVAFCMLGLMVACLRRSRAGRRLLAVRGSERAAAALGISVIETKVYAFTLGAAIAALGGILLAFRLPSISFNQFHVFESIYLVLAAVVGGLGWIAGAVIGAALEPGTWGALLMEWIAGPNGETYLPLVGAAIVLVLILHARDGLAPLNHESGLYVLSRIRRLGRTDTQKQPAISKGVKTSVPSAQSGTQTVSPHTLEVRNLGVHFDGVKALANLSMKVCPGEVLGLIGPNGAGKSTTIDAITGFVPLAEGAVLLDGKVINSWSRERRAREGLARSFQSLELFEDMTVLENLQCGADRRDRLAYLSGLFVPESKRLPADVRELVDRFGLTDVLDRLPLQLPHGQRRLAAIARTVAMNPSVLLLDEPAAGLDDPETRELGDHIRDLATSRGMAILLIEHDVSLVMRISDRVHALNFGETIAEGPPDTVRANAAVIEAYLGGDESRSPVPL